MPQASQMYTEHLFSRQHTGRMVRLSQSRHDCSPAMFVSCATKVAKDGMALDNTSYARQQALHALLCRNVSLEVHCIDNCQMCAAACVTLPCCCPRPVHDCSKGLIRVSTACWLP